MRYQKEKEGQTTAEHSFHSVIIFVIIHKLIFIFTCFKFMDVIYEYNKNLLKFFFFRISVQIA